VSSTYDFTGKTVLVTGGTRGIGAALVRAFHRAGAGVILTGTSAEGIRRAQESHRAEGMRGIECWPADFGDPGSLDAFLDRAAGLPSLDACVNNAGINRNNPLPQIQRADLDRILQVNLRAPMLICQALGPVMARNPGGGRIVNICSIWSLIAKHGRSVYGTTKAGLASFTRHIAVDLAPHGILVNSLSPGFTLTELTESMLTPEEIAALAAQVPLGRIADPMEMAQAVLFLCSDLNTFITGQNIVVDGGFTIV
jgi:3-oxoacyl-[acyl-carrier protein] reductase